MSSPSFFHRLAASLRRAALRLERCALLTFATLLLTGPAASSAWEIGAVQRAAWQMGPAASAGIEALQAALRQAGPLDADRLQAVNRFFNQRIAFREDTEVWNQVDYWASPLELLDKGQGDCEDFAIAKYFSLRLAGVAAAKLRLSYMHVQLGPHNLPHMVLAYYAEPGSDPLLLDNLVDGIEPAAKRLDLSAGFSFNDEGLWQALGSESLGDPMQRLPDWRQVFEKAVAEGFL